MKKEVDSEHSKVDLAFIDDNFIKNSKIFSKQQYKVTTYFWGQSKRGDISSQKPKFPLIFKEIFLDKKSSIYVRIVFQFCFLLSLQFENCL